MYTQTYSLSVTVTVKLLVYRNAAWDKKTRNFSVRDIVNS